ncbi:septin 2 [Gonapodya sp. JEL0774]|nr:septin 2 [Gonapodya sp. JEL0774]
MMQIPVVKKQLNGYVGFSNLPNQVHRKSIKKGFFFNLMVVGESGLGKSTLVNTLFNTSIYPAKVEVEPSVETPKTVDIQAISADIEESGVKLKLTVIDTPGFGDFVNNEDSWRPILAAIESRFDSYLEQENRVNRKRIVDNRVHACLYFIAPTGHSLKPLDIEFMRRLHQRVNLIPVIAKSDTLTDEEIKLFKQRILDDIAANKIDIYKPQIYEGDDAETIDETKKILERIPFAIVGSTQEYDVNGKKVRGRKYPWGVIEVDNEDHCDFVKLRQMLIRTHMEELKEHTNQVLYEQYRTSKIMSGGGPVIDGNPDPFVKLEEEKRAHEAKMAKMEQEMKLVFQQKVAEKEAKLKQSEEELYAKHREMKEQLERQRAELDSRRKAIAEGRPTSPEQKKKKSGLFK